MRIRIIAFNCPQNTTNIRKDTFIRTHHFRSKLWLWTLRPIEESAERQCIGGVEDDSMVSKVWLGVVDYHRNDSVALEVRARCLDDGREGIRHGEPLYRCSVSRGGGAAW